MNVLNEQVNSVFNRSFYGINPLPLPSYILSLLFLPNTKPDINFIPLLLFMIAKILIIIQMRRNSSKNIANTFLFSFLSLSSFRKSTSINSYFAEIFVFLSLKFFKNEKYIFTSFFICLLTITDPISICIISALVVLLSIQIYQQLINPKNNVYKTLLKGLMHFTMITILPLIFFICSISLDLLIRNNHSKESVEFSMPFQSTLNNFDITQGFTDTHKENDAVETNQYVMDRSIISLMSKKHNVFFSISENIKGSKNYMKFCEIHKIHSQDFDDEEPRFIKHGDFVKFKHIEEDKFIGMKRENSDEKFIDLSVGAFENDQDTWQVITEGYIKTRFSEIEFKNISSGDYLSAKMIKGSPNLSGSFYSELKSRVFYITESINNPYFIENFHDYKTRIKTSEYPTLSFTKKLQEYIKTIDLKFASKLETTSTVKTIYSMVFGLFVLFILLLNGITAERYGLYIEIGKNTIIYSLMFVFTTLFSVIIGVRSYIILSFGITALCGIFSDIINMNIGKIVFTNQYKKVKNE